MSIATNWGTSLDERSIQFPCDRIVTEPDAEYFRGVTVDAPTTIVFRWVCQLRVASYSYDRISHPGRRSPQELTPGLEEIAAGQQVLGIFKIVDFERDRHITAQLAFETREARMYGRFINNFALSYMVVPRDTSCRLLVKYAVSYRGGLAGWLGRAFTPWLDFPLTRRQLLNLKRLAETQRH
jgi:hypothetical protein